MRKVLMFLSLILISVLLLSRSAAFIPPSFSTPVAIAGLLFPVLWILNLIVLIFLILQKRRNLIISVIAVLVITLPMMLNYYTLPFKSLSLKEGYSIIDFNVHGFRSPIGESNQYRNQQFIHSFINKEQFTIACFQEYPMKGAKYDRYYMKLFEGLSLPYKELSEYDANEKGTQFIQVTASAYPVVSKQIIIYDSVPFAMYCDIQFPEGIVRVYNIHLQSVKFTKERKLLMFEGNYHIISMVNHLIVALDKLKIAFIHREHQAKMLTQSINKSPYPVIIAGDFNDTPASYAYQKIRNDLRDASNMSVSGFKRTYVFSLLPLQIDYILHSSQISTYSYQRISSNISDHNSISTRFKINK